MKQSNFKNRDGKILIEEYLPHNFAAEKMILSCLLISSEAIEITTKMLPVDAFYFKNHQELYKVIIFMSENKMPIELLTLLSFLQDNGLLHKIGGIKVLTELTNQIPNLINLEEYLKLVKDKFIRRCLIKLGYEAINSGHITNIPVESMLNDFENKLFTLTTKTKTDRLYSSAELLTKIFSELKEKSLSYKMFGLKSGFNKLDSMTQGFQKSDLIIIAGRPSTGKTALGLNIAINSIKNSKLPVLFFSFEMSQNQIMYRLLTMETGINQLRLRSGRLTKMDWLKLSTMMKILSKIPFFINDTSYLSIQDIRSKIKTAIFEYNQIGLVIIDYLQLIQNSKSKNENRVQELSPITRSLKAIAREFNIPIIALSQLSRNVENRLDKKPILSDLRESGSIEQDADLVLMLYRNPTYNSGQYSNTNEQLVELIVAKHRNGPTGTIKLWFNKKRTKFLNIEDL